jgi:hypothetical protein
MQPQKGVPLRQLEVLRNHLGAHLLHRNFRHPTQLLFGFGWIA